jgi:hypothetical protein
LRDVFVTTYDECKVGRLARLQRRLKFFRQLHLLIEDELDLLAAPLFKRGDGLPDRRVLLGVEPLLPPHHEVGGPGAEGRHGECRGENDGSASHVAASLIK